ncbi:molybdopterin molybdenumtransferase MoeA [Rhodobacterales bacterium HKCCE2091]|nr:molybdopterin molybdenumtransferase MoeA [Rhodobacterales bacterium HKCCE2091]
MTRFDCFVVVDWSAGKSGPARPSKDSIWIGLARPGAAPESRYMRSRIEAEAALAELFAAETAAGRRVLAGFDFPFGYPAGVARRIAGSDDPFALWDWLEQRIEDAPDGSNNRYAVAEEMNRHFDGPGPFWGKPSEAAHPGVPYRKQGIRFDQVAERRAADVAAKAASSCFQLAFPPTVGGQVLMGLPVLNRLRRADGVAVWPFDDWQDAPVVLAEIWPGVIEPAVRAAKRAGDIRDEVQVRLLSHALSRLPADRLHDLMTDLPAEAREEAWILGAGARDEISALALGAAPSTPTESPEPPPLRDDCFALPPGVDWTPVDEAMARLRASLAPVVRREEVALGEASGRVLAADLAARRSHPPRANSAVDGYGFAAEGIGDGPVTLPLVAGRAAAGQPFDHPVPHGYAIRILTGAALPEGVDTVVLDEDTRATETAVAFRGPVRRGANTRRAGEDKAAGDALLPSGHRLRPGDLAMLAAAGHGAVPVFARLRIAVLSTGDELVQAGDGAGAGAIPDANRPMLAAMARAWGHEVIDLGIAPDDRGAVRKALDRGAAGADAILTSGGASAGDEDHVSALLGSEGRLTSWRIALKPGRPLALALWRGKPVFGLPGNPVAAFVCAALFARPALSVLSGGGWPEPLRMTVPAAFSKRKKPGRNEYLRARLDADGRTEVFASEGSGRISGLAWAEGLVELGPEAREIAPGDAVTFLPYAGLGL